MNPTDAFVPIQTAEQLFHSAEATLLTPNGLDADKLAPVFSRLMAHDVDYADLYFQYSRSEGWSLEEGQVKSGSFNIDQGVGVRAISGERRPEPQLRRGAARRRPPALPRSRPAREPG